MIPPDLHATILTLPFENPSDGRLARHALAHPERATRATVQWLAALVARGGARYDDSHPAHPGPHDWPLQRPCAAPGSWQQSQPQPPSPASALAADTGHADGAGQSQTQSRAPGKKAGAVFLQPPPPFSIVSTFLP